MGLVENLVLLYAGILLINLIIAAILWLHDKAPLYRSVFFLWLTCVFSLTMQGTLTQNHLTIVLGFSSTFLNNIALSYLLSQITTIKVPLKLFVSLLLASYPFAIGLYLMGFSFTWIALPVVIAVAYPALYTGLKVLFSKWYNISISAKALCFTTCILGIHNIDFAFLRLAEGFSMMGFSIVIIIIFCLSIFTPAVVLEVLKEEESNLKELSRLKSAFFTNISHEFRTPLTLILGPLSRLVSVENNESKRNNLLIMQRNANRLLRLINQLLDFSRLDSGNIKLQASEGDIVAFVKGLLMSFQSFAEHKKISIHCQANPAEIDLWFDHEKMEKIIINLLSNAFKFTANSGHVEVKINIPLNPPSKGELMRLPPESRIRRVSVSISNTGNGIAKEKLPHIFERFYSVDDSLTSHLEGTGIGLALTKELVELHQGNIEVQSITDQRTFFIVSLPLGKNHLAANEIVENKENTSSEKSAINETFITAGQSQGITPATRDKKPYAILIVEDNADMRAYIGETLHSDYLVHEAFDGNAGIDKAKEIMPDLIISDIMMPAKDGYQLCNVLKHDEITSHIPIILLTAKAEKKDKLNGLQIGADDYLIKPFDSRELQIRIKNLIEQRQRLREKFQKNVSFQPADVTVTSMDESFMIKAIELIEKNIENSQFNTAMFAKEMGFSRGHLNAKLKALTGMATHEFIRTIRLKRAAQLLEKNSATVSEIAYQVGFNSLSHFSKAFKETFAVLPSDYC